MNELHAFLRLKNVPLYVNATLKKYLLIYLAMLGLPCCTGFSLAVTAGGCVLVAVCGLLIAVAFLVVECGLWGAWAPLAVALGP